nr:hypothetical protein [Tanacetum cinerariifolium]
VAGQLDDGKGLSQIVVNIKDANKRGALRLLLKKASLRTYRVTNRGDNADQLSNGGADIVVIWAYTNDVECPPKERHIRRGSSCWPDKRWMLAPYQKGSLVKADIEKGKLRVS